MTDCTALARQALRAALQLRRHLAIPREMPVNAFDIARMSGLDVRFVDAPSLEGMFVRDPGMRVFLPCLKHRARSRVLYSCAHEIGHHEFGHGTKADEYLAEGRSPAFSGEEFLADAFASHLLMPRSAVMDAFQRRGWNVQQPTPQQIFVVSGELGVSFDALITHMCVSLDLIARGEKERLAKFTPKTLRLELTGDPLIRRLVVVDACWKAGVPVDAEVGETLIFPGDAKLNCSLLKLVSRRDSACIYEASRAGHELTEFQGRSVSIRVARQYYVGPYANRYLTDPDEH